MESQELKRVGLKATLPRMRVLQLLANSEKRHLSAEDVYKALMEAGDDVGLATVYRVLTQFEAANLVTRHHFEGGLSVFELNQGVHHDHIMCVDCGKIFEFIDNSIEKRQQSIAEQHGFNIADHHLYIYGKCQRNNCPEKDTEEQTLPSEMTLKKPSA